VEEPYIVDEDDPADLCVIDTKYKLDEDFILVKDNVWNYLFNCYLGIDIPRYTIPIEKDTEDDETEGKQVKDIEYMVEVYFKKTMVYMLPKLRSVSNPKRPVAIYSSRVATVGDLKKKFVKIIVDSTSQSYFSA